MLPMLSPPMSPMQLSLSPPAVTVPVAIGQQDGPEQGGPRPIMAFPSGGDSKQKGRRGKQPDGGADTQDSSHAASAAVVQAQGRSPTAEA